MLIVRDNKEIRYYVDKPATGDMPYSTDSEYKVIGGYTDEEFDPSSSMLYLYYPNMIIKIAESTSDDLKLVKDWRKNEFKNK